jgi:hypothetical protein
MFNVNTVGVLYINFTDDRSRVNVDAGVAFKDAAAIILTSFNSDAGTSPDFAGSAKLIVVFMFTLVRLAGVIETVLAVTVVAAKTL